MSKHLARILSQPENQIGRIITKLEEASGFPSEDVRLIAENKQMLRKKISQLGLDPNDTTHEELYWALLGRFKADSSAIDRALGVDGLTKFDERISKVTQLVEHCASAGESWFLKNSAAKGMLVNNPPKKVAKKLHYRSVASMVKREDTAALFAAASVIESLTWHNMLARQISQLNASHYETRAIRVAKLSAHEWLGEKGPSDHIVADERIGVVAVWPSSDIENASVLELALLVLGGMQTLNPSGYSETLHELSPALRWWADCTNLVADGGQPVSLNIKDVAFNHLKRHHPHEGSVQHGAHSLWSELTRRYREISESLGGIPDINYNFNQPQIIRPSAVTSSESLPSIPNGLAAEFVEAE